MEVLEGEGAVVHRTRRTNFHNSVKTPGRWVGPIAIACLWLLVCSGPRLCMLSWRSDHRTINTYLWTYCWLLYIYIYIYIIKVLPKFKHALGDVIMSCRWCLVATPNLLHASQPTLADCHAFLWTFGKLILDQEWQMPKYTSIHPPWGIGSLFKHPKLSLPPPPFPACLFLWRFSVTFLISSLASLLVTPRCVRRFPAVVKVTVGFKYITVNVCA